MSNPTESPKIVYVTGGSRGIGRATVKEFAARGCRVCFFYRSSVEQAKTLEAETGSVGIRADVSDPDEIAGAVEQAVLTVGEPDILVCNAGIAQIRLFTDLTNEDWKTMMGTNLDGAFYIAREVARRMVRNHRGSIVFVGSMWGKTGASCEVHYSASKAGIRGLTMALAKELGPSGIRVNCVEPGVIDTEMNAALDEQTRRELADETPLCRIGTPEEVARVICFLSSDEASFVTGQILGVDGGFAV